MAAKKKAIAASAGGIVSVTGSSTLPEVKASSTITRGMLTNSLTPQEAYAGNIHVRKGVSGIADQISKMKLRIFSRKTGDEVLSGPLYDLLKKPYKYGTTNSYINATASSYIINGEFAVNMLQEASGKVTKLLPLNPSRLYPNPTYCRSYENLESWRYNDPLSVGQLTGVITYPIESVLHVSNYNPSDGIRGLSLLLAGTNEINTNYFIGRHNSSFFQNGANTDIIVRFPKGTDKKIAEEWVERWQLQHSIQQGSGFKISAIIGDEFQIENPQVTARDGQFLELSSLTQENIGGLLGVPPSVMGFLSKTRFDTIDVELESFAENTLLPLAEIWTANHQRQLVDKYFRSSGFSKKVEPRLTKRTKALYEKIADTNDESDLIIMLDPDSLPIMSQINANKMKSVGELCDSLFLTRSEGFEYFNLDLPDNPVRDQVWIPNTYINAESPAPISAAKDIAIKELSDEIAELKAKAQPLSHEHKELADRLNKYFKSYRTYVLDAVALTGKYDKRKVIAIASEHNIPADILGVAVHRDFIAIAKLIKETPDKDVLLRSIKDFFNANSKPAIVKSMATNYKGTI